MTLGILMYNNDWDERFPPCLAGWVVLPSWRSNIYPYVKNIDLYRCPSRPNLGITSYPSVEYAPGTTTGFPRGYGIISDSGYEGTPPTGLGAGQYMASVVKPAETLILSETNSDYFPYIGQGAGQACNNLPPVHSGVINFGFCDGHAKAMKPSATGLPTGQNMSTIQDDTTTNNYGLLIPTLQAAEQCPS